MKSIFILVMLILIFAGSKLQSQALGKEYFSKDRKKLSDSINCEYYIKTKRLQKFKVNNTLETYFCKTNSIRTIESVKKDGVRHGLLKMFDEAGNLKLTGIFRDNVHEKIEQWYPHGNPQSVETYENIDEPRIIQYWDSLGNQIITDGNGDCICYLSDFYNGATYHVGTIAKGRPISNWKGYRSDGSLYFEEAYNNGKFISGLSFDSEGNQFQYEYLKTTASPYDGMVSFFQYLANNLTYPEAARRKGIEGKVFIEFKVDQDGSRPGHEVIKGIGGGCDEAALECLRKAPGWNAGTLRGQKVSQRFVVPIIFKIG